MDVRGLLSTSLGCRSLSPVQSKCGWYQPPGKAIFSNGRRKELQMFATVNPAPAVMGTLFMRFSPVSASRGVSSSVTCFDREFRSAEQRTAKYGSQSFYVRWRQGRRARSPHGVSQLWRATGQSGTGQPVPEEESPEPASEEGPPTVPEKSSDLPTASPVESEPTEVDWRSFRARLVVTEHAHSSTDTGSVNDDEKSSNVDTLGSRWAHPILAPEAGCVLIATDKIDGQPSFERSVILLLSPGSNNSLEGPYGIILNKPLNSRIKDIKAKDRTLAKFFGDCQVHRGGPLDKDMFLLLHKSPGMKGCREVIPGVYYGLAGGLEEIMEGKRPLDFRFFFGYSGWGMEQLKMEIDAGLWCVAACSTDLITGHSAAGLWEEILMLMGGKYRELSKRPRRRHF